MLLVPITFYVYIFLKRKIYMCLFLGKHFVLFENPLFPRPYCSLYTQSHFLTDTAHSKIKRIFSAFTCFFINNFMCIWLAHEYDLSPQKLCKKRAFIMNIKIPPNFGQEAFESSAQNSAFTYIWTLIVTKCHFVMI